MSQAVILAAGAGRRLKAAANGGPKSLLQVGGRSLIEYQLEVLRQIGVDRIGVVVGYRADLIRSVLGDRCDYIMNARYEVSDSLYSLLLAREYVRGPFVLMNGDAFAHPSVFRQVLAVEGSALAYDSSSVWQDEHMNVILNGTRIRRVSKDLPMDQIHGENVGIISFDEKAVDLLFSAASDLIASGGDYQWAPAAINRIASRVPIHAVDIAGLPWAEIDFPEDLDDARTRVWPAIQDTLGQTDFLNSSPAVPELAASCYCE